MRISNIALDNLSTGGGASVSNCDCGAERLSSLAEGAGEPGAAVLELGVGNRVGSFLFS